MSNEILVAVDDGFADIKLAWYDEHDNLQTSVVPATAEYGWTLKNMGGSANINAYITGEERFTVTDSASNPIDTRFPDYYYSALNRVLIHHALYRAGFQNQNIALITGVPPADFQLKLEAVEERKAKSLANPVYRRFGTEDIELNKIVASDIGAQAISAYINLLLDDRGERNSSLESESVAVVDIGGGTTDIIAVQDVEGEIGLIDAVTHTTKVGLLKVYENISKRLIGKYEAELSARKDLHELLTTGKVHLYGQEEDVSDLVNEARRDVADEIVDLVKRRLRPHPRIRKIIFVGGGSDALRTDILEAMPEAIISEDARFANAKGMLKYKRFIG